MNTLLLEPGMPRIYTALAEWIACVLYIYPYLFPEKKNCKLGYRNSRYHKKMLIAVIAAAIIYTADQRHEAFLKKVLNCSTNNTEPTRKTANLSTANATT